MIMQSRRMNPYVPGQGFGTGNLRLLYDYMAFADDDAMGNAYEDMSGPMEATLGALPPDLGVTDPEISGVLPLNRVLPINFEPGKREHLLRMHVGGPGIDGLLQAIARTKGESTRTITGTVQNADATTAEGVRVHAQTTDDEPVYLTRSTSGPDGSYSLSVPADQEVQLVAYRRGDGVSDPAVVVEASGTSADLMMPPKGHDPGHRHRCCSSDAAAGSRPSDPRRWNRTATRQLRRADRAPCPTASTWSFRPMGRPSCLYRRATIGSSSREATSTTSSIGSSPLDAGAETAVDAQLTRVVDSMGVMCGDFHIHTHRSPDASDTPEFKLQAAAGEGLELPVRTDHEFVAAFEPVVASLGLEAWMYGFHALELTTSSFGHFGVFPLEPDPTLQNDGAIPWNGILPVRRRGHLRPRSGVQRRARADQATPR